MNYLTLFGGETLFNKLWLLLYLRAELDLRSTKGFNQFFCRQGRRRFQIRSHWRRFERRPLRFGSPLDASRPDPKFVRKLRHHL